MLAATAWFLWPVIHVRAVQGASLDQSDPPFWWPNEWRNELKTIRAMVKCIRDEKGTSDRNGRFSYAPGDVEQFAQKVKGVNADEPAVAVLITLVEDEAQTNGSRCLAATALGMFGPKAANAETCLIRVLQATDDDVAGYRLLTSSEKSKIKISSGVMLRWAAAYALGTIGPQAKRAIPVLQRAAADPNSLVANPALNALKNIDPTTRNPNAP
jgi:hypothetical protein